MKGVDESLPGVTDVIPSQTFLYFEQDKRTAEQSQEEPRRDR